MSEQTQTQAGSKKVGLFDLRWILAFLFAVYGVVVTVMGIGFTSQVDITKAGGVNVNLWTGIPMLAIAILFALWAQLRPVRVPIGTSDGTADPSVNDSGGDSGDEAPPPSE